MNTNSAQIHYRHTAPDGMDVEFSVEQIFSAERSRVTRALRISEEGLVLEAMPDDRENRYMWLSFNLPGSNHSIRALGEFQESADSVGETSIGFKHLWPEARRQLTRYLASNTTLVAV